MCANGINVIVNKKPKIEERKNEAMYYSIAMCLVNFRKHTGAPPSSSA